MDTIWHIHIHTYMYKIGNNSVFKKKKIVGLRGHHTGECLLAPKWPAVTSTYLLSRHIDLYELKASLVLST